MRAFITLWISIVISPPQKTAIYLPWEDDELERATWITREAVFPTFYSSPSSISFVRQKITPYIFITFSSHHNAFLYYCSYELHTAFVFTPPVCTKKLVASAEYDLAMMKMASNDDLSEAFLLEIFCTLFCQSLPESVQQQKDMSCASMCMASQVRPSHTFYPALPFDGLNASDDAGHFRHEKTNRFSSNNLVCVWKILPEFLSFAFITVLIIYGSNWRFLLLERASSENFFF